MKASPCRPLILLFLIFFQACTGNVGLSLANDTELQQTPLVLDGTDLLDVSQLQLEKMDPDRLAGRYSAEQGGSVLFLNVMPQGKGIWTVERIYTEPGMNDVSSRYTVRRTEHGLASEKGDFVLRQTRVGLIALEKNSGLDNIPASYWIHYIKQE